VKVRGIALAVSTMTSKALWIVSKSVTAVSVSRFNLMPSSEIIVLMAVSSPRILYNSVSVPKVKVMLTKPLASVLNYKFSTGLPSCASKAAYTLA
jgi:hypothetical protein